MAKRARVLGRAVNNLDVIVSSAVAYEALLDVHMQWSKFVMAYIHFQY